jgi:hypothetical protein
MLNIAAGTFILEWSWNRMSRVRAVDEDRDSQFPAFRRTDVHTWVKWKFLPLAASTIFIRMVIAFGLLAIAGAVSWFCRLGLDTTKPILGWRKTTIVNVYWFVVNSCNLNGG